MQHIKIEEKESQPFKATIKLCLLHSSNIVAPSIVYYSTIDSRDCMFT